MTKYKYESIDISKLVVNVKNPRYEESSNQQTAIVELIKEQEDKIINLAKDIVNTKELNPSELPIIAPLGDGSYEVLEGNRRVVALKLLHTPDIIKTDLPLYCKKFKVLHAEFAKSLINEIECVVYENREDANHWIKLKHIGEDEGRGVVSWNSFQKQRFEREFQGKTSIALQVIDFIKDEVKDTVLLGKLSKMSTTNLERLVTDKNVQNKLGISIVDGQVQSETDKNEVKKGLLKIVKDISDKTIKVGDIYTKDDRKKYIDKFLKTDTPDVSKKSGKIWTLQKNAVIHNRGKKKRSLNQSTTRKHLIPTTFKLQIQNTKINAIYDELRKLDVEKYKNAVAVLFRVFFEQSIDYYIKQKSLKDKDKNGRELSLANKAKTVAEYFKANSIMTKDELKGINTAISNADSVLSIDTFHAYVHRDRKSVV